MFIAALSFTTDDSTSVMMLPGPMALSLMFCRARAKAMHLRRRAHTKSDSKSACQAHLGWLLSGCCERTAISLDAEQGKHVAGCFLACARGNNLRVCWQFHCHVAQRSHPCCHVLTINSEGRKAASWARHDLMRQLSWSLAVLWPPGEVVDASFGCIVACNGGDGHDCIH